MTAALRRSFDSLQVPQSFDDRDLDDRFYRTWRSLRDPLRTIERTGGYGRFINRQVLPINPAHPEESLETVPNYALHLVGGGLVYRCGLYARGRLNVDRCCFDRRCRGVVFRVLPFPAEPQGFGHGERE